MQLSTCCTNRKCTSHCAGLDLLRTWGISPVVRTDDGVYFEFDVPAGWPQERFLKFVAALRRLALDRRPDAAAHACAHCNAAAPTCFTCCTCAPLLPSCTACL